MPPGTFSRYQFCVGFTDPTTGAFTLNERVPFAYQQLGDTVQYIAQGGDTLWGLAARYYAALVPRFVKRAEDLWWVIADFQPQPITDATIALQAGQILSIPSAMTVQNLVFNPALQQMAV